MSHSFSETGKISVQFTKDQQRAIERVAASNGISFNAAVKVILTAGIAKFEPTKALAS